MEVTEPRRVIFRASESRRFELGLFLSLPSCESQGAFLVMPVSSCVQWGCPLVPGFQQRAFAALGFTQQALPHPCCFFTGNAPSQKAYPPLPPRLCSHLTHPKGEPLSPHYLKSRPLSQMLFSSLVYLCPHLLCPCLLFLARVYTP